MMYSKTKRRSIQLLATLAISVCLSASAQAQDLVSMLTGQLGVSKEQASGGAGAIFDYAKNNLSADDFSTIAGGVPDMDELLTAAPAQDTDSPMGKVSGLLGGGDSGNSLSGLTSLASSFDSLGLDADSVSKFLPIVNEYVGSVSGEKAMSLLSGLF